MIGGIKVKDLIKKVLNRETISYVICGVLTTVVSMGVYWIGYDVLAMDVLIANILSWILAVLFAYVVNKIFVFQSKTKELKEIIKEIIAFFGGRVGTLLVETLILFVFVTTLGFHEMLVKLVAQFVVLVLNYVISKLFIFKKK